MGSSTKDLMASLRAEVDANTAKLRQERKDAMADEGRKRQSERAAETLGVEGKPAFDVFEMIEKAAELTSEIAELKGYLKSGKTKGNDELEGRIRATITELEEEIAGIKTLFPNEEDFDLLVRMEAVEHPSDAVIDGFAGEMRNMGFADPVELADAKRLIAQSKKAETDELLMAEIKRERPDELRFVFGVRVRTGSNTETERFYRIPQYNLSQEGEREKRKRANLLWKGLKRLRRIQRQNQSEFREDRNNLDRAAEGKTTQDLITGPVGTVVALRGLTKENPWRVQASKDGKRPGYDVSGVVYLKKVGEDGRKPVCAVVSFTGNTKGTLKYAGLIEEGFLPFSEDAKEEKLFAFSAGFRDLRNSNGSRLGGSAQEFLRHARGPVATSDEEGEDEAPGSSGTLDVEEEATA